MKKLMTIAAAAGVMAMSFQANAYTTYSCGTGSVKWSGNTKTMYVYEPDFPVGSTFRAALWETVGKLNQNPSNFKIELVFTNTAPSLGNGRSEISIQNISPPGVTYFWWNGACNFTEADVIMDSSVSWTTSIDKSTVGSYGGSGRPFQTTLLHELGHVTGLGHEADEYNIMGQDWNHLSTNYIWARSYFGEDAGDGAVALYGSDGTQDLGIVHWKHTGNSGEYSTHGRTRILDASTNAELSYTLNGYGERKYNVARGQQVKLELTYENNGNNYQYEDIGYYVSTNDLITTVDTLLTTSNLGLSPDNVYTITKTLTIPSNLSCSTDYWLGAIIDKDSTLVEFNESNNATYVPINVNWDWSCLFIPPVITL